MILFYRPVCKIKTTTWQTIHGINFAVLNMPDFNSVNNVLNTSQLFKKKASGSCKCTHCSVYLHSLQLVYSDILAVYYSTQLFMSFCCKSLMFVNPIYNHARQKSMKGLQTYCGAALLCSKCKHGISQISILKNNIMYK